MSLDTPIMVECDHSDDRSTCPVCIRESRPRQQDPWSRAFAASYDDDCDGCPNVIRAGELIRIREHPTEDRKERRHVECC